MKSGDGCAWWPCDPGACANPPKPPLGVCCGGCSALSCGRCWGWWCRCWKPGADWNCCCGCWLNAGGCRNYNNERAHQSPPPLVSTMKARGSKHPPPVGTTAACGCRTHCRRVRRASRSGRTGAAVQAAEPQLAASRTAVARHLRPSPGLPLAPGSCWAPGVVAAAAAPAGTARSDRGTGLKPPTRRRGKDQTDINTGPIRVGEDSFERPHDAAYLAGPCW